MKTHYEYLEAVLSRTEVAVVVKIENVGIPKVEGYYRDIEVTARPLKVLFGKIDDRVRTYTYSEGLPHVRGTAKVSPLVSGSGQEFSLKKGAEVILMLSADMSLLRVESLENLQKIHRDKRTQPDVPADTATKGPLR